MGGLLLVILVVSIAAMVSSFDPATVRPRLSKLAKRVLWLAVVWLIVVPALLTAVLQVLPGWKLYAAGFLVSGIAHLATRPRRTSSDSDRAGTIERMPHDAGKVRTHREG